MATRIWKPLEFYSSAQLLQSNHWFFAGSFKLECGGCMACLVHGSRKVTGELK